MQNIMERWQDLPREDLFQFWQDELALKKELRNKFSGYREIRLNNAAEYHFLRQSLAYGEHRELFYTILFLNINHQPIQYTVLNGPLEHVQEFLHFLPQVLRNEKPSPRSLQFLINIYREDYHAYYINIVQTLTEPDCAYLMERTASKPLRQLLQDRQLELGKEDKDEHYGLMNNPDNDPKYPDLYGDKIQTVRSTITGITSLFKNDWSGAINSSELESLLETADLLFMVGLLDDCMTLLLLVYQQHIRNELSFSQQDNLVLKNINKIVRRSLPVYYLLSSPTKAFQLSLDTYQLCFSRLLADEASLRYLDLYATLLTNDKGNPYYTLREMAQNNERLNNEGYAVLLEYLQRPNDSTEEGLLQLCQVAHAKITASPHESFVIMEIIRWLERVKLVTLSRDISTRLLRDYLQLFQWIPCPMFLNNEIHKQLSRGGDDHLLNQVECLLSFKNRYSFNELRERYAAPAEPGANDRARLEKQLLLGSFLGVFA